MAKDNTNSKAQKAREFFSLNQDAPTSVLMTYLTGKLEMSNLGARTYVHNIRAWAKKHPEKVAELAGKPVVAKAPKKRDRAAEKARAAAKKAAEAALESDISASIDASAQAQLDAALTEGTESVDQSRE